MGVLSLAFLAAFFLCTCQLSTGKEVCYDTHVCQQKCYGCFNNNYPFSGSLARPVALLPESPTAVGTLFKLFNRDQRYGEFISKSSISDKFNEAAGVKFIVHGFLHNANRKWVTDMKDALLRVDDFNVITVDWSKGNGFPYTQATANAQIVGAEIAIMIRSLMEKGTSIGQVHCIGHSLGSHICGYAGKRFAGELGRITGLDPAGPYFESTDPVVRLAPTDAVYVDAIHTDGTCTIKAGLGMMQAIGHADFYVNGGLNQPDCPATPGKLLGAVFNLVQLDYFGIEDTLGCSHFSAVFFFTDSIESPNDFTAYPCKSEADFKAGKCLTCIKGCNKMGYWSSASKDLGPLYLDTKSPTLLNNLVKQNYKLTLYSESRDQLQARGIFKMYFKTLQVTSPDIIIEDDTVTFKRDSPPEVRLLSLNKPVNDGPVLKMFVSYQRKTSLLSWWLFDTEWTFSKIEVFDGDKQINVKLCPFGKVANSLSTVEYRTC